MRSEAHKARMEAKAATRQEFYETGGTTLSGFPANINRHTGEPHTNAREIARNLKK